MLFVIRPLFIARCPLESGSNEHRTTDNGQTGFSLLELIITLSVLAILVMGTIPLSQNAIKRQKELRLRESLAMMRSAIDEFKRDTIGACAQGAITSRNPADPNNQNIPADPRSRVVIDDCEIFDTLNLDRYPPSLEVLVEGVKVKSRGPNTTLGGGVFNSNVTQTDDATKEVKKIYLREIPVDPMTGSNKDWKLQSSYQEKGEGWDGVNVFDVSSSSDEEAFNGEKYSDW
jgi:general secretion pathway protein G